MGTGHSGIELMESAPVGRAIVRLALPMAAALLAQAVYGMTDVFFIGQTNDPNMVAAVSLAFPLFMLSQALGNVFAVGGSSYISRKLGEKANDEARFASSVSFYLAIATGVLLAAALLAFKGPLLRHAGASDATFAHTDDYFSIVAPFMALAAAGAAMSGQMRSEGAAQKAMVLQLIGIALNVVLDPILILWCGMGTAGAAWATVAGQAASFAYGVYYFLFRDTVLSIRPADFMPNRKMVADVLAIGVPAGIAAAVMSFSLILTNRVSAGYGDHVVAGFGVQMRVAHVFFMLVFALAMGYQPFAGYSFGARKFDRLRRGFNLTLMYSTGLCVAGSIILRLFGKTFIGFFVRDAPTIEAGTAILHPFLWALPFVGAQVTLLVSFQALGRPVQAMVVTLGRQLLFFVPLLYLLNHMFGFNGFMWAQPIAEILNTVIALLLGRSLARLMPRAD